MLRSSHDACRCSTQTTSTINLKRSTLHPHEGQADRPNIPSDSVNPGSNPGPPATKPPDTAATVRLIFKRYAELGSVALLRGELDRQDIVSKRREGAGGRLAGGNRFSRGALYLMLQNRIYRGEIVHQGEAYPGQHEAILDPELWQIVQNKLAVHRQERALAVGAEAPSLLAGLIVDAGGSRM